MTWKAYAAVSGATVVAGWLASAPPTHPPNDARTIAAPASAARMSSPRSSASSDIADQAARLQARPRGEQGYANPVRDPFRFAARVPAAGEARSRRVHEVPGVVAESLPRPALPPPVSLSGIAEDEVNGQPQRTAVMSSPAGVVLVREGDEVAGRYRVVRIESDAIELVSLDDASTVRLTLRH